MLMVRCVVSVFSVPNRMYTSYDEFSCVFRYKMNRAELLQSTGNVLVFLKAYNYKLCQKGLLERGQEMKIPIGKFVSSENKLLKKTTSMDREQNLLAEFKADTASDMAKELKKLTIQLKNLGKSITGTKDRVKLCIGETSYAKWSKSVDGLSMKFKQKYSNECNDLYNHYYKMNKHYDNTWGNIVHDINSMVDGICGPFSREVKPKCRECTLLKVEYKSGKDDNVGKQNVDKQNEKENDRKMGIVNIAHSNGIGGTGKRKRERIIGCGVSAKKFMTSIIDTASSSTKQISTRPANSTITANSPIPAKTTIPAKNKIPAKGTVPTNTTIPNNGLIDISDDELDESSIINDLLTTTDEIGHIEMGNFNEFIEKYL